ncbi:MAG: glycosyltransferase family 2 protein [Phycisphaerales bacterium]|nr:glycosyltransferase family 2 protein [Phycisphaerales bacterium]
MHDAPSVRLPLSVAIICMNSERTIGRTLASVAPLASEIICLDSGSTDATLDICRRHGAVCEHQSWRGHIKQKQSALDRCTQPWIVCLDSDESLEPALAASLREVIERDDPEVRGYELNRKVWYAGRLLDHAWQPEWRLRLVRQGVAVWGGRDPHDKLEMIERAAKIGRLRGDLRHDSFADIADYLSKQVAHSRTAAANGMAAGQRAGSLRLVTSPCAAWCKQMIVKRAWRDGWRGWAAASATAAASLMKHLILLEQTCDHRDGGEP